LEKAKDTREELVLALEEAENQHVSTLGELKRTKSLAQTLELEAERREKEVELARERLGELEHRRAGRVEKEQGRN